MHKPIKARLAIVNTNESIIYFKDSLTISFLVLYKAKPES